MSRSLIRFFLLFLISTNTFADLKATDKPVLADTPAGYSQQRGYGISLRFSAHNLVGALQRDQSSTPSDSHAQAPEDSKIGKNANPAPAKKRPIRIAVLQVGSTVESSFSTDGLQQELVNDLNFLGGQAVVLSSDPHDREAGLEEAKEKGCDYAVFTTINAFKTASVGQKLGSVFNRGGLGGVGGSGQGRVELNAEVKVFQPDGATPLFDGDVNFRQNDADSTSKGLMKTEARNVMLQIKKLQERK